MRGKDTGIYNIYMYVTMKTAHLQLAHLSVPQTEHTLPLHCLLCLPALGTHTSLLRALPTQVVVRLLHLATSAHCTECSAGMRGGDEGWGDEGGGRTYLK